MLDDDLAKVREMLQLEGVGKMADVKWNEQEKRWELWIDGKLKAYTKPEGSAKDLIKLAEDKGYTVKVDDPGE